MSQQSKWTCGEIALLHQLFPYKPTPEIAERLGRTVQSVAVKANKLGLHKKYEPGYEWTPEKEQLMKSLYPIAFTSTLVKLLNLSKRTVIRKAREMGLEKEPGFLDKKRGEINEKVSHALKMAYREGRLKGNFIKGVRNNPEGEFRKGHVESPESKARRVASLKRNWARRKIRESIRL